MDNFNYSEVKNLLNQYKIRFSNSLTPLQKDLLDELTNKLKNIDKISTEIVDLISSLFTIQDFSPNENDIVTFGQFRIKLQRADSNIPIRLGNAGVAYSPEGKSSPFSTPQVEELERKLERDTIEFYLTADRMLDITKTLPNLNFFKFSPIRIISNQLIKHPEGKNSGITYDSFSYTKIEGPYVKGLRKGKQIKFMDKGFKNNSEEFISKFKEALRTSLK